MNGIPFGQETVQHLPEGDIVKKEKTEVFEDSIPLFVNPENAGRQDLNFRLSNT
ncbi:hypothetical protein [Cohnella rhizosphaerae]|uniref:Uncharacterized protein n=1 Tax=Cohnella rhizosphaerae TaxID=1457232 RepID=A0A9X4KVG4_9BACL|nr:hypothetical protein [Cohnella rhizosphaerae]MDG0811926.1 hypothetical protein [Cohnella rhizosphaerae]